MAEACTRPDSQLGQTAKQLNMMYKRTGLLSDYDLSETSGYNRAKLVILEQRLRLLIAYPPCGPWSAMQNANQQTPEQRENLRRKQLRSHRIFDGCKRLAQQQVQQNGTALAEQPVSSRAWEQA
mgnify:CR=1 FL=1